MVLLGGLEVVAAGYLLHKHQQNKKERQRLEEERLDAEEEEYRRRRPTHRRHHSHSPRRHSHHRPHSHDGRYRPESSKTTHSTVPSPAPIPVAPSMHSQPTYQTPYQPPPPQYDPSSAPQRPPQDVKYGWSSEAAPQQQQQPQQQQTQTFPITGIPAEWGQQASSSTSHLAPQTAYQPRARSESRASDLGPRPRVRFADEERRRPASPPPRYRP